MAYRVKKTEVRELKPGYVKYIAEMAACPGDRPLSKTRVAALRQLIRERQFISPHWAIGVVGGMSYRLNGKHSSHALLEEGIPPGLQAQFQVIECDTTDDLAAAYAAFDGQGSARSPSDINVAAAAAVPVLEGIKSRRLANIVGGIIVGLNDGTSQTVSPVERVAELGDVAAIGTHHLREVSRPHRRGAGRHAGDGGEVHPGVQRVGVRRGPGAVPVPPQQFAPEGRTHPGERGIRRPA